MRRPVLILVSLFLSGIILAGVSYLAAKRMSCSGSAGSGDDLAWLQKEFRLTDAEMARIRPLHDGYLPKCHEMCERIAAKQRELHEVVSQAPGSNEVIQVKLGEVAALRAQCQAQMLAHFWEVSQAMPAEQGRRYLEQMQHLTLGSHEQLEKSMAPAHPAAHGNH
jgi:hypothetical protein